MGVPEYVPARVRLREAAEYLKRSPRLSAPRPVLESLGLTKRARLGTNRCMILCPWHDEKTPSCSVGRKDGVVLIHCFGCGRSGDVLDLIAAVRGLDCRARFRDVVVEAADLVGVHGLIEQYELTRRLPAKIAPAAGRSASQTPEPRYPKTEQVEDLWHRCIFTSDNPEVATRLRERCLDANAVDLRDLARALPHGLELPSWARTKGGSWAETGHHLIVPMFDARGALRSLRACRLRTTGEQAEGPKSLPPTGYAVKGLIMADTLAQEVLRTGARPDWVSDPLVAVICEGESDWLTYATWRALRDPTPPFAVFGIVCGAWTEEIAARIPSGTHVDVWTDPDSAGDRYAAEILRTLRGRCDLRRPRRS